MVTLVQVEKEIHDEIDVAIPHKKAAIFDDLVRRFPPIPVESIDRYEAYLKIHSKLMKLNLLRKNDYPSKIQGQIRDYLKILRLAIKEFENKKYSHLGKNVSGIDALKYLIAENHLKQSDLSEELGGQSSVSLILNGERKLTRAQIEALSKRFAVSPAVFFIP